MFEVSIVIAALAFMIYVGRSMCYGAMTIERYQLLQQANKRKNIRIYFNGEDRTKDCRYANDITGEITLLKRNEAGQYYVDFTRMEAAQETLNGLIEFRWEKVCAGKKK